MRRLRTNRLIIAIVAAVGWIGLANANEVVVRGGASSLPGNPNGTGSTNSSKDGAASVPNVPIPPPLIVIGD